MKTIINIAIFKGSTFHIIDHSLKTKRAITEIMVCNWVNIRYIWKRYFYHDLIYNLIWGYEWNKFIYTVNFQPWDCKIWCFLKDRNVLFWNLNNYRSHLNIGSNADSCLSNVCITAVFLNFDSSEMASSFSDTASAEKVFLINFSSGFLKSTPSDRFNGRFIQPAILFWHRLFAFTCNFFLWILSSNRCSSEKGWKLFLEVYKLCIPVSSATGLRARGTRLAGGVWSGVVFCFALLGW